uniref:Uncharacterized protein n=1 Tax=Parascaris equorum TaxID=6256 RepID=A0A914RBK7_PAREQ
MGEARGEDRWARFAHNEIFQDVVFYGEKSDTLQGRRALEREEGRQKTKLMGIISVDVGITKTQRWMSSVFESTIWCAGGSYRKSSVHLEEDEGFELESKRNFAPIAKIRITLNGAIVSTKKKDNEED